MTERSALFELTITRFREFYREPGAVFWAFGFPMALVLVLGYAFRDAEPGRPAVAVVETEPGWLIDALQASDERLDLHVVAPEEASRALRAGKVDLLVGAESEGGERRLAFRFDPASDAGRLARMTTEDMVQRALGREDVIAVEVAEIQEPGSRYVDFLFPGILGLNLMGSSMWAIGFSVVVARKRKILKRLAATPMRRGDFVLSYFLSRLIFLVFEVALLLLFAKFVFGIVTQGSTLLLAGVALLGAASFAAISLVIAARVESLEAAYGWMNAVQLPMWLLSGAFFSYERFPEAIHPGLKLLPLTALNDALRAVMNDGVGALGIAPEIAILVGWSLLGFLISKRFFRWQ